MVLREWKVQIDGREFSGIVPCTVFSLLRGNGLPEELYRGTNERQAEAYFYAEPVFSAEFTADAATLAKKHAELRFACLDTLCTVYLNGVFLGRADNFHRVWRFNAKGALRKGKNRLEVRFSSALRYAEGRMEQLYVWGNSRENGTLPGISYVRKPYYTFGWDWCPPFPDAGILGEVRLDAYDMPRLRGVLAEQEHTDGRVILTVTAEGDGDAETSLYAPDGTCIGSARGAKVRFTVDQPQLWWPNGYGAQPLYTLRTALYCGGVQADEKVQRIGLRTLALDTAEDGYGKAFAFVCNGVKLFAKGANIIPYDCLLWQNTAAREERLLRECAAANFNMLRVWGGGYYGSDRFYDLCDELGILVWQDFMIACAHIRLDEELEKNILAEAEENVLRIRNHPSLALLCGNNEMEPCAYDLSVRKNFPDAEKIVADYLYLYEDALPALTARLAPQTAYWPSSPSAGGNFYESGSPDYGDSHFWGVWGELQPAEAYRKHAFRFLSEFGFIAFPSVHTLDAFSSEQDRNIYSEVMECHQKNAAGNAKCAYYLRDYFLFPSDFETLVFATQYVQADALETAIAHLRSHYGRCMGALIWQLNDAYPGITFSLIDYYGRRKPAFYAVQRACRNVSLFAARKESEVALTAVNETAEERTLTASFWLADAKFDRVYEREIVVRCPPFSAREVFRGDFGAQLCGRERELFFGYKLTEGAAEHARGSLLFVPPRLFRWAEGEIGIREEGDTVALSADVFRKFVKLEGDDELLLSDNCVDLIEKGETVLQLQEKTGSAGALRASSLRDIK